MAAFGVAVEASEKQPVFFEVWPDNEEAVLFFLRCCTQWRASFSGVTGLDYNSVFEILRLYGKLSAELFEDIQIMERAALAIINKPDKS